MSREPMRRNARSNRARILAAARHELGRNPDITLEEIARAAGVARRTLFGHFPGRAALVEALTEEASEALRTAMTCRPEPARTPDYELARLVLRIWPVGDRYRLLLALVRQDLGAQRVSELLAPVRKEAAAILERGQNAGVFHTAVPSTVLSVALEAMVLSLLDAVSAGACEDDGTQTAVAVLVAAGVPAEEAVRVGRVAALAAAAVAAE